MTDPVSLVSLLWSDDPLTRRTLSTIVALVVPIAAVVFLPLCLRLLRLFLLERRLRDTADEYESKGPAAQRSALREWLRDSPLQPHFEEFDHRWHQAQVVDGGDRSPIRLLDVLEDRPLLPFGPRRSLLPALPGLFLGIGVLAAIAGLIAGLASLAAPAAAGAGAGAVGGSDPLALQLGLALRATAWGFAAAISAHLLGRLVEGGFEARSRGLDAVLARAYRAVSPGELAEIGRQTQQQALDTLGRELTQFAHELNERLERGLQRIEQSSSRAASLVSQEQRGALHTVVQELSLTVRQGVEHHLAELRNALQRTIEYQSSVTNGLSESFERMAENAALQDRVARALAESAGALDAATRSLASELLPNDGLDLLADEGTSAPARAPARPSAHDPLAEQIAATLGQALRGFTEQVEKFDHGLEALRQEIRDESRRARPAAAAAESASLRPRAERGLAPDERSGTAASKTAAALPDPTYAGTTRATPSSSPAPPPIIAAAAATATTAASTADGPLGRELSLSGFRVGAPRALGPDPYERLAKGDPPSSNVRPFPLRERELGDDLKLSGLLGPSGPRRSGGEAAASRGGSLGSERTDGERSETEPQHRRGEADDEGS